MKPKKVRVNITLDEDLVATLKREAELDERSFSQYLNKILRAYANQRKDKKQGSDF